MSTNEVQVSAAAQPSRSIDHQSGTFVTAEVSGNLHRGSAAERWHDPIRHWCGVRLTLDNSRRCAPSTSVPSSPTPPWRTGTP